MRHKFISLVIIVIYNCYFAIAQLPSPIRFYPLNDTNAKEIINRKDGIIHGQTRAFTDRFGNKTGAIHLFNNSYIETPIFFNDDTYINGFTISFWIYIDQIYTKKNDVIPWNNTDTIYRAFYGTHETEALLGFYQRRDRAVLDRYVINIHSGTATNYGIWYWDPINFTSQKGWYHIFISYQKNMTTLFQFTPSGGLEYALHYMQIQNLSQITDWGIGGKINNSAKYLDDFKIYSIPLSIEQIKQIHTNESLPNGMYTVSSAFDSNYIWQTKDKAIKLGALLYTQPQTTEKEPTMQWVFEPILNKPGQCKIRMAYFKDLYLSKISQGESSVGTDIPESSGTNWIIEPTGDNYYFIKSANEPNLYLKSEKIPFSSLRSTQALNYNSSEAPFYKWHFNLLYLQSDLLNKDFDNNTYELVDGFNTVFSLLPELPFTESSAPLSANRGNYPSLLTQYQFKKGIDNSYTIYNRAFSTKAIQPQNNQFINRERLVINDWHSGQEQFYRFIIERPNPLGKHIQIRPILAQNLIVYSGESPTANQVTLRTDKTEKEEGYQWQAFNSKSYTNINKQVSTITPGIYKINSAIDNNKFLAPKEYKWAKGTNIILSSFNPNRETGFYWIIDYEKDDHGKNIKDGTYTIQLYGGDDIFIGPNDYTIPEGERIKNTNMNRNAFAFTKWFITPTRDRNKTFYIQSAADKWKYIHTVNSSAEEMNEVEYSYLRDTYPNDSYKWNFQKINIKTPLEPGVYKISMAQFHIHTRHDTKDESIIELGEFTPNGTYEWQVELNPDNSYSISLHNHTPKLYIHTNQNSVELSATLGIKQYDSNHSETYKWLIAPTDEINTYYVKLVGNTEGGYMHIFSNSLTYGTPLEIYKYIDSVDLTYKWKFEKIE